MESTTDQRIQKTKINDLEDRAVAESNKAEQYEEKRMKRNENSLRDLCYNFKGSDIQVQAAQRAPNKMKPRNSTSRHIIIKMQIKDNKRILKAAREGRFLQRKSHNAIS